MSGVVSDWRATAAGGQLPLHPPQWTPRAVSAAGQRGGSLSWGVLVQGGPSSIFTLRIRFPDCFIRDAFLLSNNKPFC